MSPSYIREIPIIRKPIIHTPTHYNSDNHWAHHQIHRPHAPSAPSSSHHTITTNRVVPIRSPSCWRDYFQASKYSDKLIVIYFTASWCGPCRFMAPVVDEFASHYANVAFNKIDVDELFNVSHDFGVQTMPTFLFIKRGTEIDRVTGARRDELQRKIEKHRDYPHY